MTDSGGRSQKGFLEWIGKESEDTPQLTNHRRLFSKVVRNFLVRGTSA